MGSNPTLSASKNRSGCRHPKMKNNPKNFLMLTVAICLLLSVTLGCSLIQKAVQESRGDKTKNPVSPIMPSNSAKSGQDDVSDNGLTEKSNLYIQKCFNNYSNRLTDSYRRYASWIKNIESGPTGKESIVYGLYSLNGDGKDCFDAIEKAKQMEPNLPDTEAVADEYADALKESIAQINGIYAYYDQDDYKDDNFERGKKAHPALLKSFRNFEAVNKKFGVEVDKLEDQVAQEQMAKLENDPARKFDYLLVKSGVKSKKIAMLAQRTEFADIKADELQTLIDDFDQNTNELKTAASNKSMASSYTSACDGFLKASKELMRRVRDKKPFSETERMQMGMNAGWMVEGSPDKVIHEYNDLVQSRSYLSF